jgi:hypothetical protein
MAKTTTNPFTQTIRNPAATLVNADSFIAANGGTSPTNIKELLTAGSEGSIIKSLTIASDDSSARTVSFYLSTNGGTTDYLLFSVPVAANSGVNGTTINVDVLSNAFVQGLQIDQSGRPIIALAANAKIFIGVITAAVTAGRTLHVVASVEDF